jgi:SAM-dependent methyltransferase
MSVLELEQVACPRCRSTESRARYTGRDFLHGVEGTFTAVECVQCGLWFQNPRPTEASIGAAYPGEYAPHSHDSEFIDPPLEPRTATYLTSVLGYPKVPMTPAGAPRWWQRWRAGVDLIPAFVPGGRLLEIGSASGGRLRALRALGWSDLTGIEMVDAAASAARAGGFDVRTGPAETVMASMPDASFDTVIASFVLEHLFDPFHVMREIARVLKPGGELLFSTITRDSLDARVWGAHWAGFDFPRHMVYFRTADLRRMVEPELEWRGEYYHHAMQDFAREAWWRLMDRRNLTDRIVGRLVKTRAGDALGRALAWNGMTYRISIRCRRK